MLSFDSELRDQAYQFFIQEAVEFLQILETGLMDLTHDHSTPKVHELMRAAHSIKGGAASVGLNTIKQLAHQLEDCLRALYQDTVVVDTVLEDLLLQALDCLQKPLMQQIETGQHDEEAALAAAEPVYSALVENLGDALQQAEMAMPTAAELGIDIVQVIFTADVQQGIYRIEQVAATANLQELTREVQTQAEVFVGVGELVNLPGWVAIAKAILTAIQQSPEQVQAIAAIAVADLKAAQKLVLDGDRHQGGEPSTALLAYAAPKADAMIIGGGDIASDVGTPAPDMPASDPRVVAASINEAPVADLWSELDGMTAVPPADTDDQWMPLEQVSLEEISLEEISLEQVSLEQASLEALDELFALAMEPPNVAISATEVALEQVSVEELDELFGLAMESPDAIILDAEVSLEPASLEALDELFGLAIDLPDADTTDHLAIDSFADLAALLDTSLPQPIGDPAPNTAAIPLAPVPDLSQLRAAPTLDDQTVAAATDAVIQLPLPTDPATAMAAMEVQVKMPAVDIPVTTADLATSASFDPASPREEILFSADASVETTIRNLLDNADRGVYQRPSVSRPVARRERTTITRSTASTATINNQVVRVDLSRLERINNLVGAMVTQENATMLHSQQMQTTTKSLLQRFHKFEAIARQIRHWSDRSQKMWAKLDQQQQMVQAAALPSWQVEFDPLQMDSYGELDRFAQEMLELMAQIGEGVNDVNQISQQSLRSQQQQQQILKQIREDLHWARMLPFGDLLQRFPRMMRDLSARYGKPVKLELSGTHTLVDKSILQNLYDPLVHLLRNAFDHGIESPEERQAQNKPVQATITIDAYHRSNHTYIEIIDDGRGIDPERLRAKVIENGLLPAPAAQKLNPEQLYQYLFSAGFSTAGKVSELSGRGVGLDAVHSQVAHLKGSVSVTSTLGQGTKFTLKLPLTLTVANLLVFTIQKRMMAVPIDGLKSIIAVPQRQIQMQQGRKVYSWQGQPVSLCPRSQFIQAYPLPDQLPTEFKSMVLPADDVVILLLVEIADQTTIALVADQIIQAQELAIKPFGQAIMAPPYFSGCTIMGNGLLVPVLDIQSLAQSGEVKTPRLASTASLGGVRDSMTTGVAIDRRPVVLVVDDSLTARQTLALTLQDAGYRVLQAKNGREGLEQLAREPDIRVVFSDVEMPQMNGFEFLSQCRKTYTKEQLPIIMVTSRGGDKHRQIAEYMGANAYLTKPYLSVDIFRCLESLLPQQ